MKLSDIGGDEPHIKEVDVRLVGSEEIHKVGLRVLTATERERATKRAIAASLKAGQEKWDEQNPICALHMFVETVAAAAVDLDSESHEPWATSEELLNHHAIGQETLLYLYEMYEAHEQIHSIRPTSWDRKEFLDICLKLAGGDASPLDRMRLGSLRTFSTFMADQYVSLLNERWQRISDSEQDARSMSTSPSSTTPKETPDPSKSNETV